MLQYHGFTAVMFAPLSHLGNYNTWDALTSPNLAKLKIATAGELRALDPGVWEVGSHGLRHVDLRLISPSDRRIELMTARERLSAVLGRPVLDLAYPYGGTDAAVRRDVEQAGYRMAFAAGDRCAVGRFQLPRRPISGDDSLEIFRIKTSAWSNRLYRAYAATPSWVRGPAVAVVRRAATQER
jgi:peptidoglycan/xylan/chitin deacetylase (PgdA/CDA1 family)